LGQSRKAQSILGEEVSSSPDKTENTILISSIRVTTSAEVIVQITQVVFEGFERAGGCKEPLQ